MAHPHRCRCRTGLLLAALALTAGCRERAAPELRIGLITVTSGPMAAVSGLPSREGATLAVEELNAAGGVRIGGVTHTVVLVERAVETIPSSAAEGARALINLDHVHAIVGPQISAQALAAGAVSDPAGVPLIAPMASNPAVTAGRPHVLRLAFVDAFQGSVLARFAHDSLHLRTAAVLYDAANPYGRDIAQLFSRTFGDLGGRVTGEETFTSDVASDFRPQLRRLLARRPDALLLPNYALYDSVQVRQARELGFRGTFLGSDSWDPPSIGKLPEAAGSVLVANWDARSDRAASQRFVGSYRARFGTVPRSTAAATYDAVHLVALAAARAGTLDGDPLAGALRAFGPYDGASAAFEFTGSGDPRRGAVVLELRPEGDRIRFVGTLAP